MSSIDPYSNYSLPPSGPYKNAIEVQGDDNTDLPVIPGALIVNHDYYPATLTRMTMQNGETVTMRLQPGVIHRLRPTRIHNVNEEHTYTLLW